MGGAPWSCNRSSHMCPFWKRTTGANDITHAAARRETAAQFEALLRALIAKSVRLPPDPRPGNATFKLVRNVRFSRDKSPFMPAFRAHIGPMGKRPVPWGTTSCSGPAIAPFWAAGCSPICSATRLKWCAITLRRTVGSGRGSSPRRRSAGNSPCGGCAEKRAARTRRRAPAGAFLKRKSWYLESPRRMRSCSTAKRSCAMQPGCLPPCGRSTIFSTARPPDSGQPTGNPRHPRAAVPRTCVA